MFSEQLQYHFLFLIKICLRCTSNMWRSLWQWLFLFSCFSCSISESSTPSDFKLWGAFTFSRPCLASHRINWPSFVCIQDTKHVEREARAVPHLPACLHRRRLPLLQQPQVFPRLLRQVSWCRCHEYNRNIVSYHSGKANSEEPWVQWFRNKTEVFSDHVCQISITYKTSYISN